MKQSKSPSLFQREVARFSGSEGLCEQVRGQISPFFRKAEFIPLFEKPVLNVVEVEGSLKKPTVK